MEAGYGWQKKKITLKLEIKKKKGWRMGRLGRSGAPS